MLKPGDKVTIGLGTHDMEVEAWITFPDIGTTHEKDPNSSPSCGIYRLLKSSVRPFDKINITCIKKPNCLTGTIIEFRTNSQGQELALVEFANTNKQRWVLPFLLNCPKLSATGRK